MSNDLLGESQGTILIRLALEHVRTGRIHVPPPVTRRRRRSSSWKTISSDSPGELALGGELLGERFTVHKPVERVWEFSARFAAAAGL
ncbi:hypothetical protein [Streptomyces yaizuensis]|uniref:Uncharacterized protein n=1 Tax=Streptomyces yaizuensis TaxID=2989713 RepID=A0ABQ5P044_9ACTN|nr:hypothetical protein [Streptomyces sp. YSPA8]GLF95972.1 hypothetical protein SYYSPA8_16765 [Streptomyces sp. YSPA8]